MKVSQAIKYLSEYDLDDEIIIEWWSRDFAELHDVPNHTEIPLDIWNWVAQGYEFNEMTMSEMSQEIIESIAEAIAEDNNEGETK